MALIPKVVSSSLPNDVFLGDVVGFAGGPVKIPAGASNLDLTTLASCDELAKSFNLAHIRDSGAMTIVSSFLDTSVSTSSIQIRGAFATAETSDMNVANSIGLVGAASGSMKIIPAGATLLTAATSSNEKVAILQVHTSTGVVSKKDGALVAAGSGLAVYPTPDASNILLAYLFTAASPILSSTTTVADANVNNNVAGR